MKPRSISSSMRFLASFALFAAMLAATPQVNAIPALPAAAALQSGADEELEDKVRGALGATGRRAPPGTCSACAPSSMP